MMSLLLVASLSPTAMGAPSARARSQAAGPVPEYELTSRWLNRPASIGRGEPVTAEWHFNVNDAHNPPANEPVANVVATFAVEHARFTAIPDLCRTSDVDPVSSISADGRTLTCNLGELRMGTAVVLQTAVDADGATGDQLTLSGSIGGKTAAPPPIRIVNDFRMDIHYRQNTSFKAWDDESDPHYVDLDLQWTLRLGKGADAGPDKVTYTLTVTNSDGDRINVGADPRNGAPGCTPHDRGGAVEHPYSGVPNRPEQNAPFVRACTLTKIDDTRFQLTLDGIDYSLAHTPAEDSSGNPLPANWDAVAAGSLWFRIFTDEPGAIELRSNAPAYTSVPGLTARDLTSNNETTKAYNRPGAWSAHWERTYTKSGGTPWDDSYRVPIGTTVRQRAGNTVSGIHAPTERFAGCLAFDTKYVTYEPGSVRLRSWSAASGYGPDIDPGQRPYIRQYYTGAAPADPDRFDCSGDRGWTATEPADGAQVKAVRVFWPYSRYGALDASTFVVEADTTIHPDVAVGQDIWMFGSVAKGSEGWFGPGDGPDITPTPDARYPNTTGRRDILRVVSATPELRKKATDTRVTPGEPSEFTLIYSADGGALTPPTVDDYEIVDTLPPGMTYVAGSASPEPRVRRDDDGRQVLTWTLDDVPTNTENTLTYQVLPGAGIEPGAPLTNVAVASLDGGAAPGKGATSGPAKATVMASLNGYTRITERAAAACLAAGTDSTTGSWTVRLESRDPARQRFTDTIAVLPHNDDAHGTSYAGDYSLDGVMVPDGATVYYTDAAAAGISDDPADAANGAAGDPAGNTVGWTTEKPDRPTAIRVVGGALAPGQTFEFTVNITTRGTRLGNAYWLRSQARAAHTELVMRTSAHLKTVPCQQVTKTADPASGSQVAPGDVITYTVTVKQLTAHEPGIQLVDDLTRVTDDAVYNNDAKATTGTATHDDGKLFWTGELAEGGVATITYSVTVKDHDDAGDRKLDNTVGYLGGPGVSRTHHTLTPGPDGGLATTGSPVLPFVIGGLSLLLLGGATIATVARRRRADMTE